MNNNSKFRIVIFLAIASLAVCLGGYAYNLHSIVNMSLDKKVDRLINSMTINKKMEKEALMELEKLPEDAAPYIISHLGDMRLLPEQEIQITNTFSGATERASHHGAEVVHDALSVLLQHITGYITVVPGTKSIHELRMGTRMQWIAWCREKYPSQATVCEKNSAPIVIKKPGKEFVFP